MKSAYWQGACHAVGVNYGSVLRQVPGGSPLVGIRKTATLRLQVLPWVCSGRVQISACEYSLA